MRYTRVAAVVAACSLLVLSARPVIGQSLADRLGERLDREVPGLLARFGEAGLAVALVEECRPTWVGAYGVADRETDRPVTPETIFQVGSISKTVTAWTVLKLVEEGAIGLDAPVSRYLSRWELPAGEFVPDDVTVRRLLSHTAGINLPSVSGVDRGEEVLSIVDELAGRGPSDESVRVVSAAGETYAYSGGGYLVLQLLIEEVTGRSFADHTRRAVLEPLGMDDSGFGWSDDVEARVATPYREDGTPWPHRLFAGLGAAGLYATPADLATFLAALCEGSDGSPVGRGVLAPATIEAMTTAQPAAPRYGLGYEVYPSFGSHPVVGHGGSNLGWKANVMALPSLGLGIAVASNNDGGRARKAVVDAFVGFVIETHAPAEN